MGLTNEEIYDSLKPITHPSDPAILRIVPTLQNYPNHFLHALTFRIALRGIPKLAISLSKMTHKSLGGPSFFASINLQMFRDFLVLGMRAATQQEMDTLHHTEYRFGGKFFDPEVSWVDSALATLNPFESFRVARLVASCVTEVEDIAKIKGSAQAFLQDIERIIEQNAIDIIGEPVWSSAGRKTLAREQIELGKDVFDATWSFWRDWYQGFLEGKPLDWELQRRVALIPDADWEKGPAHIAAIIEEIRRRFELEQRIAELEAERDRAVATETRLGIGGNNPPEPLEDTRAAIAQTSIIWAAIDDLKEETASDTPDNSRVGQLIETLSKGLLAVLAWCGRKGDLTVDTLIKWGVPIGAASLLANAVKVKAVIEAAKAWVGVL